MGYSKPNDKAFETRLMTKSGGGRTFAIWLLLAMSAAACDADAPPPDEPSDLSATTEDVASEAARVGDAEAFVEAFNGASR